MEFLAGQLVARRMRPGMLVLLYLVSWELGNLLPLLSAVIPQVRIVQIFLENGLKTVGSKNRLTTWNSNLSLLIF